MNAWFSLGGLFRIRRQGLVRRGISQGLGFRVSKVYTRLSLPLFLPQGFGSGYMVPAQGLPSTLSPL